MFIIYNALLYLNLKPSLRSGKSNEYWAKLVASEIYENVIPTAVSPRRLRSEVVAGHHDFSAPIGMRLADIVGFEAK